MTFYTYMLRNYKNKNSAAGTLVGSMKREKDTFPRNGDGKYIAWHEIIRAYLRGKKIHGIYLETFEKCWLAYVQGEKARKNGYARKTD